MFADMDERVGDMLEYKDDGCIELVLKVLARICDGQHVGLQVRVLRCRVNMLLVVKCITCIIRSGNANR